MDFANSITSYWFFLLLLAIYYASDLVITKIITQRFPKQPVSSPIFIPRAILNLVWAKNALQVVEQGYQKFKNRAFQIIRGDGNILVLPSSMLEEFSSLPFSVASPYGALEHDLLGSYTGLENILENRLHHTVVQRKITPRLGILTPDLERELTVAVEEYFPNCDEWTPITPFRHLGKVEARTSSRALVGPELCRHPIWLDISINYAENVFKTVAILRLFPPWARTFFSRLCPSYWYARNYIGSAKELLGPIFNDLLSNKYESRDDNNPLAWLVDIAKEKDRNPNTLAYTEVLVSLASVHTSLLRIVNALYDLCAYPEYFGQIEAEIESVRERGWTVSSYSELKKLDSILRESQRFSPPSVLGLKRLFKQDFTFSNGLYIPKGSYVCMPTYAIENDPENLNTQTPEAFDGLRSYRLRMESGNSESHQFSTIEKTVLGFGYGKAACPGRFFASLIVKMMFVKLLTEYEFKFLPGTSRPQNLNVHELILVWPQEQILMRRKKNGVCPF